MTPATFRYATAGSALSLALLAGMSPPAQAQQKLLPAQSEISFTSKQMGVPVDGRFRTFEAQIAFDPQHPEAGSVAFSIDLTSVSLGTAETEAEIAKPGWFDSRKIAQATFRSTALKSVGANRFEVTGTLSIKGIERKLVVPVTLAPGGANRIASGSFVIQRLDYKIGDGDWNDTSLVANDVQVRFKLALAGVGAS